MNTPVNKAIDRIQQLQQAFAKNLAERINELQKSAFNLDIQSPPTAKNNQLILKALYELAHKLSGSAGTFQFTEVYTAALNLEHFCERLLSSEKSIPYPKSWLSELQDLLDKIKQGSNDKAQLLEKEPPIEISITSAQVPSSSNKIILVDDDELLAALIQEQARHFGFNIQVLTNPDELSVFLDSNSPEVILMDIVFPNYDFNGIDLVKQLNIENKIQCPVIFLSNRDDFNARLDAVRAGSNGYIVKPVNILELVEILDKHTYRSIKNKSRALLIDDDVVSSAIYKEILQSINFECETINNPLEAFEILGQFNPDIILLDIHMPNCSGYEVAEVVRQDTRFTHVPILFLSADNSEECEVAALKAGGTCFINKGVDRTTFITNVITQSQRSRELHAVIDRLRKDELRFQAVSHSTSDAIITLNTDGLIILWNEGAEQIFGYQSIEVIGQSIEIIIPPKFQKKHRQGFQKLITQKTLPGQNAIESQARCKNGRLISIELSYSEWLSGNERFFTSIIRDTTHRKEVESQLKDQQENLRAIVTNSAEGIITIDSKGIIEMANPKAYQIFAYVEGELEGQSVSLLMPKAMRSAHDQYLNKSEIHTPKIINKARELLGLRKDGSNFPMELNISPMSLNGEKKFVGILHDITERNNALKAITNAKLAAEEANKAKSSFLSSMSHELRTPLNAVIGFSQLLQVDDEAPLNANQQESVEHIYSAGQHLLNLINEVLDLAKIESNQVNLSLSNINLISTMKHCLSSISPQITAANLTLEHKLPELEDIFIHADESRLIQIMSNLLTNAIKYNRKQGHISVYLAQENNKVRIFVKDTGLGIPESMMKDLFIPFNRLGAEQSDIEGTGIGLTITKTLVEMMNGKIGIDNQPGVGCTFWVEFLQTGMSDSTQTTDTQLKAAQMPEQSEVKILYIEDNKINRLLMKKIINTKTDFQYHEAISGLTGIQAAIELQPHIILLDINLPDMDGYEIYQKLRLESNLKSTKVIIVSANAMPEDIAKSEQGDFFDYITKPIDQHKMLHSINKALGI